MRIKKKILATIMLVILLSSNLLNIGAQVIATSTNLPQQNSKTNSSNVEFNSYLDGEVHEKTFETSEKGKLYLKLSVKENGYLKNEVVEFKDANFSIDSSQVESSYVQKIEDSKIYLNQIQSGEEITIELPITFAKSNQIDSDYFSKDSKTIFTATYVNGNGDEKKVEKTITNRISWKVNPEVEINGEISKYIPYHIGEEFGLLVQSKINLGIKDNLLPISALNLELVAPEINAQKPDRVTVIANSTKATNGSEKGLASTYTYNSEEGKVVIQTLNEVDEQGKITWGQGKDEYIVTYIYTGEDLYNNIQELLKVAEEGKVTEQEKKAGKSNEQAITGNISLVANVKTYNAKVDAIEIEKQIPYSIEETIGELTTSSIETVSSISKAYLYANYDKQNGKKETTYDVTFKTNISDIAINNQIEYKVNNEKIEYRDNQYLSGNNIYAKQIKIPVDNFLKILGEEGKLDITKIDGTVLGSITNQSEKDENENYIFNIDEKMTELVIKAVNPVSEGKLEITVSKVFSLEHEYTLEQMKDITKIETSVEVKSNTNKQQLSKEIQLQEVTNNAEISIKDENLSTVVVNEDVQIRVVLDTSSLSNALYKNPTLKIKLPSYISDIKIKSKDILMNNGLKIKSVNSVNEDGSKVIIVELEGTQTDYTLGAEYKGTIIILNADITVKTLTPTNESKIVLTYTNENEAVKDNKEGIAEATLNFVAPKGVVAANAIANYANKAKTIMSISAEKTAVANLDTYSEKKIATVTGTIVNNYGNKIKNVKILGRLPSKGNKKIDSEENLGSTFDAIMADELKVTGLENYKVYYSNKVDANANLEDTQNGWTENFSKSAKSYLILPDENYEMDEQKTVEFSYDIEIPANLSYNNSAYEMYKVYYTNVSPVGIMNETKESSLINATTGEGPNLDIKLESSTDVIREGQIVTMKVTISNKGDKKVTNATLNIPKPEIASFGEYYEDDIGITREYSEEKEITLGTINPGETITENYYLIIDSSIADEKKDLSTKVTINCDEVESGIPSNEFNTTIKDGDIKLELISDIENDATIKNGEEVSLRLKINKISGKEELENISINIPLLKGTTYKEAYFKNGSEKVTDGITYNSNSHTLQVKIDTLSNKSQNLYIKLEGKDYVGKETIMATAKAGEGEDHYSNIFEYSYSKIDLQISDLTSSPRYVKEGDPIEYKFDIKNVGDTGANYINIKGNIPNELLLTSISYKIGQDTEIVSTSGNNIDFEIYTLQVNETATVTITARAKSLNSEEERQVKTSLKISAKYFDEVETNQVTNTIEYNEELHNHQGAQNPSGGTSGGQTTATYKITGTAWLDENKDGKRDETEKILSDIPVVLVNKANNTVVADKNTNAQKRTTTNSNGIYEFTNIPRGEYLVLFLYDASNYSTTKYQAEGVDEGLNSDAIDISIVFEGEKRIAGIADVVKVTDSNVRDIDIGLYVAEKFDLRIDKSISKITLTTPTIGTRVTTYNEEQLAKVEILGNNVNKSSIIVEYKIKVTNEGKVAGYAKKIVDYLPEDAGFSSEVNSDWYLSEGNQNAYNTSLANTIINPGESKEVKLVLSFNITDKNIGNIVNNNAEIYESYNEQGIEDMDSVAGNKASNEDDISKADIVLGVVTGKLVIGSMLIVVVLAILIFGIYEIKKRILTKNVK